KTTTLRWASRPKRWKNTLRKPPTKKMNAAPGAHAHLGLLLSRSGDKEGAFRQFEEEKRLFPESGVFMDFLMKTGKGGKR
ncbi:LOW QUALITY PROTEIN: periplasmic protein, partial [Neisseria gonorrhoeae 1291]